MREEEISAYLSASTEKIMAEKRSMLEKGQRLNLFRIMKVKNL